MKNIKEGYFVGEVIGEVNNNTFEVKVLLPEKTLFQEDTNFSSVETDTEVVNTWENSFIYAGDIVYIYTNNHVNYEIYVHRTYTFHTSDIMATDETHIEKIEKKYEKEES